MKLSYITQFLNLNFDLKDDKYNIEIKALNTLAEAKTNELTFFNNKKYENELKTTKASAILIEEKYLNLVSKNTISLISKEPYVDLAKLSKLFAKPLIQKSGNEPKIGENITIMPNVYLGKNVIIGKNVTIMANSFIGDFVEIGGNSIIYPNVSIYRDCKIGENCIIHSGAVIGSDGFGFAHTKEGKHIKIYQNGNVIIENDVEIGANTTIDRAVFGSTIIKSGTKIDNLVQIGHNCLIGENSIIVSQVGISGSSELGKNVIMGGQSATAGHLKIGDFATIAARGGVTKSIKGNKVYAGFPLMEHKEWLKLQAKISKLNKE